MHGYPWARGSGKLPLPPLEGCPGPTHLSWLFYLPSLHQVHYLRAVVCHPTEPKSPLLLLEAMVVTAWDLRFHLLVYFLSYKQIKNRTQQRQLKSLPCCLVAFRSWLFRGQGNQLEFNLRIVSSLQERTAFCFASFGSWKCWQTLCPLKKKCIHLCAFCYATGHT